MIALATLLLLVDGEKWPRPEYVVEVSDPEPDHTARWPRTPEQAMSDVADGLAAALDQAFFATAPRNTIERMLVAYGIEK